MPKPTKAQIDAEIVDRAAGLFAKHGFDHTSLQQIADAVNYSKAGLLHHYPSKQAIYEAGFKASTDHLMALLASVEDIPPGIERDRAAVEASVDFAFELPGVSAFANRLAGSEEDVDPKLTEMGLLVYKVLGTDLQNTTLERIIRVTSAFTGLSVTALLAVRLDQKKEWRGDIVASAMDALGHGEKRPAPTR